MKDDALDRVERLIIEACRILECADADPVYRTYMECTASKLRDIVGSDMDPCSLRNIRRTMETDGHLPLWMRPLDSPKHAYRKIL